MRVERFLDDRVGVLRGDFLDLDAAFLADHHDGAALRPVDDDAEVIFLGDIDGRGDAGPC